MITQIRLIPNKTTVNKMHNEKLETKDSSQLEILTSQLQKIHEEAIGTFDDSIPAEEVSS